MSNQMSRVLFPGTRVQICTIYISQQQTGGVCSISNLDWSQWVAGIRIR